MTNKRPAKRGFKGRGYSLKATAKNHFYVYIWDEYSKEETKKGKEKNDKNYAYCSGWKSLGRYGKADTMEALRVHLIEKFGTFDEKKETEEIELLKKEIIKKQMEREKKEFERIMKQIFSIVEARGEALQQIPTCLEDAKIALKELVL